MNTRKIISILLLTCLISQGYLLGYNRKERAKLKKQFYAAFNANNIQAMQNIINTMEQRIPNIKDRNNKNISLILLRHFKLRFKIKRKTVKPKRKKPPRKKPTPRPVPKPKTYLQNVLNFQQKVILILKAGGDVRGISKAIKRLSKNIYNNDQTLAKIIETEADILMFLAQNQWEKIKEYADNMQELAYRWSYNNPQEPEIYQQKLAFLETIRLKKPEYDIEPKLEREVEPPRHERPPERELRPKKEIEFQITEPESPEGLVKPVLLPKPDLTDPEMVQEIEPPRRPKPTAKPELPFKPEFIRPPPKPERIVKPEYEPKPDLWPDPEMRPKIEPLQRPKPKPRRKKRKLTINTHHDILDLLKEVSKAIVRSQKKDIPKTLGNLTLNLGQAENLIKGAATTFQTKHLQVYNPQTVATFAKTMEQLTELLQKLKGKKRPTQVKKIAYQLKLTFEDWKTRTKSPFGKKAAELMEVILQNIETLLENLQAK